MINTTKRSILAVLFFAIGMVTFAVAPALAEPGQNEQPALATVKAGPLEISPTRVNLALSKFNKKTCFLPTIRLKIKNTTASDVRVILFKNSFQIIDELDYTWFVSEPYLTSGGVALSKMQGNQFAESFTKEKDKFVTVPPQQTVEAPILLDPSFTNNISYHQCVNDDGNELLQTHRPKTISLSASIGIIKLDNAIEIVPFSFSDLPVTQITVK